MAVELDAAGKPYVRCPNCARLHLVRRNKSYEGKAQTRFRCGHCTTKWPASVEDIQQIKTAYEEPKQPGKKPASKSPSKQEESRSWKDKIFGSGDD